MYCSLQLAALGLIVVLGLIISPVDAQLAAASEAPLSVVVLSADEDADDQRTPELMLLLPPGRTRNDPAAADSAPRRLPANRTSAIVLGRCQVASSASISPSPLRC